MVHAEWNDRRLSLTVGSVYAGFTLFGRQKTTLDDTVNCADDAFDDAFPGGFDDGFDDADGLVGSLVSNGGR